MKFCQSDKEIVQDLRLDLKESIPDLLISWKDSKPNILTGIKKPKTCMIPICRVGQISLECNSEISVKNNEVVVKEFYVKNSHEHIFNDLIDQIKKVRKELNIKIYISKVDIEFRSKKKEKKDELIEL